MTQQIGSIALVVLFVLALGVTGCAIWLRLQIKKQSEAAARLAAACPAYETNAKLQSDFRVIRHDFANYVQAAGAVFYDNDELKELVREQKKSVRRLVEAWNRDAALFGKEHEGKV